MITLIKGFLGSMFSSNKASNTALDIVNKIAGTGGMTAQEQADFLIRYQESTKHQSVARRFIALLVTGFYVFTGMLFLGLEVFSHEAASSVLTFLKESLANPFNIVLGFYFTVQIVNGFKGK